MDFVAYLFITNVFLVFVLGHAADQRGRSAALWMVAAFFFGPFAVLGFLAVGSDDEKLREKRIHDMVTASCFACKEEVRAGAKKCPHCHSNFA